MPTKQKKNSGTTLIEILIYIALIGMIVGSIILLTGAVLNSHVKTKSSLLLEENLRFAMEIIKRDIFSASDISLPLVGEGGNTATITFDNPVNNPTIFFLDNGAIMVQRGAGQATAIISDKVEVISLVFTRLNSAPASLKIEIVGQLRDAVGAAQSNFSINDTAVIHR